MPNNSDTVSALSKLALIAFPIVQHYREDLTVHDRHSLENAVFGDVFIWCAVPTGTHLIKIRSNHFDVATAIDMLDAVEWGYDRHITSWWSIMPSVEGFFTIAEVAKDDVRRLVAEHQIVGKHIRDNMAARFAARREAR